MRWCLALAFTVAACGQAFEVASIKPSQAEPPNRFGFPTRARITVDADGGLRATQATLFDLILRAYGRYEFQVTGGPEWIRTARFDLAAKAPAGTHDTRAMLRSLLAERFALRVRAETRDVPMFDLTLSRPGRLRPSSSVCADPCQPEIETNTGAGSITLRGKGASMAVLARWLTSPDTRREVRDATGLEGTFDFELTWAPEPLPGFPRLPNSENGTSLFTALPEQLGLKLEASLGPGEVLAIESAEPPGEN